LGWTIGSNVRIDYRWATSDVERSRYAAELVALKPDVLFATSVATVGALQQATRTVPIVFVTVPESTMETGLVSRFPNVITPAF
jgi:putative tryptophan/tyrosine transport system substrate-binding protein